MIQHTQLPNGMADQDLKPIDQLVYVVVKSFEGKDGCYPSQATIADRAQISVPTVKKSIDKLIAHDYIHTERRGRKLYYTFNKTKKFEPFSLEFLQNTNITPTTKSYIIATQQYMYKDVEGLGKTSYSYRELSEKINMPAPTIHKCDNELKHKNYLTVLDEVTRDMETGCFKKVKVYNMENLGQAVIWKLKEHEERLAYNEERIENTDKNVQALQERIEKMEKQHDDDRKLINALLKKTEQEPQEYKI